MRLIRAHRALEVLPTATVWLIITAPVWGALVIPAALGFGLVIFSLYWLWKSLVFASGVLIGFWRLHNAQQRDWIAESLALPGYEKLHHLVIVPTFGESEEIVADTLHYLALQDVALERVSVVLAFEERDPSAPARAQRLSAPEHHHDVHQPQDAGRAGSAARRARRPRSRGSEPGGSGQPRLDRAGPGDQVRHADQLRA